MRNLSKPQWSGIIWKTIASLISIAYIESFVKILSEEGCSPGSYLLSYLLSYLEYLRNRCTTRPKPRKDQKLPK